MTAIEQTAPIAKPRQKSRAWRKMRANRGSMVGMVIIAFFAILAIAAPILPIADPIATSWSALRKAPSAAHWLGTDDLGRDILSRMIWGARASLMAGVVSVGIAVAIGVPFGLLSGYFGGVLDQVLMRAADIVLGLPFLPFVIVVTALLGPQLQNIVFAVGIMLWPNAARVIRSQVLTLSQRQFVEAARVTGAGEWRILFVHVAPSVLPFSALYGAFAVGWAILTQASISFLGFGDSDAISWGTMLQDAYASQALDRGQYAWFIPAGLCIVLVVLAGFLVSRGYEELLFPKLRDDQ